MRLRRRLHIVVAVSIINLRSEYVIVFLVPVFGIHTVHLLSVVVVITVVIDDPTQFAVAGVIVLVADRDI